MVADLGVATALSPHPELVEPQDRARHGELRPGSRDEPRPGARARSPPARAWSRRRLPTAWAPARWASRNTTAASALTAALTGADPAAVTGRGTGVDDAGLARKVAVVRQRARGQPAGPRDPARRPGGARRLRDRRAGRGRSWPARPGACRWSSTASSRPRRRWSPSVSTPRRGSTSSPPTGAPSRGTGSSWSARARAVPRPRDAARGGDGRGAGHRAPRDRRSRAWTRWPRSRRPACRSARREGGSRSRSCSSGRPRRRSPRSRSRTCWAGGSRCPGAAGPGGVAGPEPDRDRLCGRRRGPAGRASPTTATSRQRWRESPGSAAFTTRTSRRFSRRGRTSSWRTTEGNREEHLKRLEALGLALYIVKPVDLASVLDAIGRVGRVLGQAPETERLVAALRRDADAVSRAVEGARRPRVLYVVWGSPLIVPGPGHAHHRPDPAGRAARA